MSANHEHCGQILRNGDRDAWLAALYAPAALRPHLHALDAFALELAQVRDKVQAPLAGEIRLQWWRDALRGRAQGDVAAHPIAAALLETIAACKLPKPAFDAMIEARIVDLYDDPMPDLRALEAYCGAIHSARIRFVSLILSQGAEPGGAAAAGHAGMAVGIGRIARDFARDAARGQIYAPLTLIEEFSADAADVLARRKAPAVAAALARLRAIGRDHSRMAQAGLAEVAAPARAAFLALAMVEGDLRAGEKLTDPFLAPAAPSPLARQWRLWRYARANL